MSRDLLEECRQAILVNLQKWQHKDEVVLYNVLQKIETELAKDTDCTEHLIADAADKYVQLGYKYCCIKCCTLFKAAPGISVL
jgi:hypothetical protein